MKSLLAEWSSLSQKGPYQAQVSNIGDKAPSPRRIDSGEDGALTIMSLPSLADVELRVNILECLPRPGTMTGENVNDFASGTNQLPSSPSTACMTLQYIFRPVVRLLPYSSTTPMLLARVMFATGDEKWAR